MPPLVDGPAATVNAMRHQTPLASLRLSARGVLDAIGGMLGREPLLVPLAAQPGRVAVLSTPDSLDGDRALHGATRYPQWRQEIAARSALRTGIYRPARHAPRIACPLLIVVHDRDQSALAAPAIRAGRRVPDAEIARLPGGHYAGYLEAHQEATRIHVAFLERHLRPTHARARNRVRESARRLCDEHLRRCARRRGNRQPPGDRLGIDPFGNFVEIASLGLPRTSSVAKTRGSPVLPARLTGTLSIRAEVPR